MEAEWGDVDVVQLINLVELNQCLYNVTSADYRNKDKKKSVLCEIATTLNKPGKYRSY